MPSTVCRSPFAVSRPPINVVWFKRDLRLRDHEPLVLAQQAGLHTLLLYVFEPSIMAAPQYDVRHWRFVHQSLVDMNRQLESFGVSVAVFHEEVTQVFERLLAQFSIQTIFSYRETGLKITYDRDKAVASFCSWPLLAGCTAKPNIGFGNAIGAK